MSGTCSCEGRGRDARQTDRTGGAALLAIGAAAISPWGVQLLTGRPALTSRLTASVSPSMSFLLAVVPRSWRGGAHANLRCVCCSGPYHWRCWPDWSPPPSRSVSRTGSRRWRTIRACATGGNGRPISRARRVGTSPPAGYASIVRGRATAPRSTARRRTTPKRRTMAHRGYRSVHHIRLAGARGGHDFRRPRRRLGCLCHPRG